MHERHPGVKDHRRGIQRHGTQVSRPVYAGGPWFCTHEKWNMGWMNDQCSEATLQKMPYIANTIMIN